MTPLRGSLELICYAAKVGIIDIKLWKGGLPMDNSMKLINRPHRKRRDIFHCFCRFYRIKLRGI
jgi:hypothetical protein